MIYVDIKSDIDQARKDVARFFNRQIPYATMLSINSTARDVQTKLRDGTIPNAWTVRNKALSKAMTTFIPDEKSGIGGLFKTNNFLKGKDTIVIGAAMNNKGWVAGEGFAERQVTGAVKKPKNQHIAVPQIGPGLKRLAGGSIPDAKKPKNLIGNEKFFIKGNAIFERMGSKGDKLRYRYALPSQAKGTKNLAGFYPDAYASVTSAFPGHFETAKNKASASSRFKL
jgi:hypothetical protein